MKAEEYLEKFESHASHELMSSVYYPLDVIRAMEEWAEIKLKESREKENSDRADKTAAWVDCVEFGGMVARAAVIGLFEGKDAQQIADKVVAMYNTFSAFKEVDRQRSNPQDTPPQ